MITIMNRHAWALLMLALTNEAFELSLLLLLLAFEYEAVKLLFADEIFNVVIFSTLSPLT